MCVCINAYTRGGQGVQRGRKLRTEEPDNDLWPVTDQQVGIVSHTQTHTQSVKVTSFNQIKSRRLELHTDERAVWYTEWEAPSSNHFLCFDKTHTSSQHLTFQSKIEYESRLFCHAQLDSLSLLPVLLLHGLLLLPNLHPPPLSIFCFPFLTFFDSSPQVHITSVWRGVVYYKSYCNISTLVVDSRLSLVNLTCAWEQPEKVSGSGLQTRGDWVFGVRVPQL